MSLCYKLIRRPNGWIAQRFITLLGLAGRVTPCAPLPTSEQSEPNCKAAKVMLVYFLYPRRWAKPGFTNYCGQRLSRFGVIQRLRLAVAKALPACPSLRVRRISPHTFRHYADLRTMPTGDQPSLL